MIVDDGGCHSQIDAVGQIRLGRQIVAAINTAEVKSTRQRLQIKRKKTNKCESLNDAHT